MTTALYILALALVYIAVLVIAFAVGRFIGLQSAGKAIEQAQSESRRKLQMADYWFKQANELSGKLADANRELETLREWQDAKPLKVNRMSFDEAGSN